MADLTRSPGPEDSGAGGCLAVYRLLLALLIAVSVTLAPIGAAMAAVAPAESAAMADMADCPSKAKQTSKDCSCCDTKAAQCQDDFCLAKCFKLNGQIVKGAISLPWSKAAFSAAAPTRPPDSSPEPQKRPPRI